MLLHPLFAPVPDEQKRLLSMRSRIVTLKKGEVLAESGQTCYDLFMVVNGRLRVDRGEANGPQTATGHLVPMDLYCESLTGAYVLENTLVAALNSTVQVIPLATFQQVARRHPEVLVKFVELVHLRTQDLRVQLRRIHTQDSEVVIGRAMFELSGTTEDGTHVLSKRVTQVELANYAGVTREQVNKKMREFEAKGLIRRVDDGYELDEKFSHTNMLAMRD